MQKLFNNKELKNALSLILTVVIGLLGSSMGSWDYQSDSHFALKLISLLLVAIVFLVFLVLSYIYDRKEKLILDEKEKEIKRLTDIIIKKDRVIKTYEKSHLALSAIFQKNAEDINCIANNICNKEDFTINIWNFKKECKWICEKVLEIIEEFCEEGNEIAVSVFQKNPIKRGKAAGITMIAHSSKYGNTPDVFEIPLTYRKNSEFYAIKLFRKGNHEPTILIDKNEVNEKFIYKNENSHPNYSQYVAIPIHCNGNEMLSLLQIVSFNETRLGNSKLDITEIVNKFVLPYTQLGLMSYKYEKSLLNSGYIYEKLKGDKLG